MLQKKENTTVPSSSFKYRYQYHNSLKSQDLVVNWQYFFSHNNSSNNSNNSSIAQVVTRIGIFYRSKIPFTKLSFHICISKVAALLQQA